MTGAAETGLRSRPPAAASQRAKEQPTRPWQVAVLVLVVYAIGLGAQIRATGITSFIGIGTNFSERRVSADHRVAAIARLHSTRRIGYDGQFVYYIALSPLNARWYIDDPPYRYGRILYPITVWLLALGQPGALPYTMLAINLAAIVATVFLLAGFLRRRSLSAWWAAVYGFFPGITVCLWFDLTEPLAFFLAACGLVLIDRRPERALRYAPLFALAVLTKETTALIALVVSLAIALEGREGIALRARSLARSALFTLVWLAPAGLYKLGLAWWLGHWPTESPFTTVPFQGLDFYWPFDTAHVLVLLTVVIPGLVWLALGVLSVRVNGPSLPAALAIANTLVFVVFLPNVVYFNYESAGRASTPIALSAILLLPSLRRLPRPQLGLVRSAAGVGVLLLTPLWMVVALIVTGTPTP
jgi:hypothetical protein